MSKSRDNLKTHKNLTERRHKMEENRKVVNFEEVLDTEIDDIWDIFFPYMAEKKEKISRLDQDEQTKPRRYLKFLTM